MRICVVGAGYVGLATAVMFGKLGHEVVCADVDRKRVRLVRNGSLPFHEPHLERWIRSKRGLPPRTTRSPFPWALPRAVDLAAVGTPVLTSNVGSRSRWGSWNGRL